ncbi:MAG: DUF2975 domain-containing protein [Erysipelotrichaceae bacterium]|nr:DUF2975 domain-containing protein [Erysipelotrichaceae bacterium]
MDYNNDKSVKISKYLIRLSLIAVLALAIMGVFIINYLSKITYIINIASVFEKYKIFYIISTYSCLSVGFYILISLSKLLNNIDKEEIFTKENIALLRYISWACFVIALIGMISIIYDYAWVIVFFVGVFMGMLLRVIKNVFSRALEIKEENDFTV